MFWSGWIGPSIAGTSRSPPLPTSTTSLDFVKAELSTLRKEELLTLRLQCPFPRVRFHVSVSTLTTCLLVEYCPSLRGPVRSSPPNYRLRAETQALQIF